MSKVQNYPFYEVKVIKQVLEFCASCSLLGLVFKKDKCFEETVFEEALKK